MTETFGESRNDGGCGGPSGVRRERDEQGGFVHALWLLVVLSAFLFGATVVNIGIAMKIYKASTRQTTAIEKLNLSIREVQQSVLYLSEVIEETTVPDEEDSDRLTQEGRI